MPLHSHFRSLTFGISTILLLLAGLNSIASAQTLFDWEEVNDGIRGATISSLLLDRHDHPIISTEHGIYLYDEGLLELEGSAWYRIDTVIRNAKLTRAHDGTIFAWSMSGVYSSTDDGRSWRGTLQKNTVHFAALSDSVFLWTEGNGGRIWTTKNEGAFAPDNTINVDYIGRLETGADGTLYALAFGEGLWRSVDSGKRWQQIKMPGLPLQDYFVHFDVFGSDTVMLFDGAYVVRSIDRGESWEAFESNSVIDAYIGNNGLMYGFGTRVKGAVSNSPRELYFSTDAGENWTRCGTTARSPVHLDLMSDEFDPPFVATADGICYQAVYGSLYESRDSGRTWNEVDHSMRNIYAGDVVFDPGAEALYTLVRRQHQPNTDLFAWEQLHTLYRLDDKASSWQPVRDSVQRIVGTDSTGNCYVQIMDPMIENGAVVQIASRVEMTSDMGETWRTVAVDTALRPPTEKLTLYTITASRNGVVLLSELGGQHGAFGTAPLEILSFISVDSGATWERIDPAIADTFSELTQVGMTQDGMIHVTSLVVRDDPNSTYAYSRWKYDPFNEELTFIDSVYVGTFIPFGETEVYADRDRKLQYSTDRGTTWTPLPLPFPEFSIFKLDLSQEGVIFVQGRPSSWDRDSAYYSRDNGTTWNVIPQNLTTETPLRTNIPLYGTGETWLQTFQVPLSDPNIVNTFSPHFPLYRLDEPRTAWEPVTGALRNKAVTSLTIGKDGDLYVATRLDGIYRSRGFQPTSGARSREPIRSSVSTRLSVSPIPARGSAMISLELNRASHIRLELFDPLGRTVSTVADEQSSDGRHRFALRTDGLTAGVYFLRLVTASGTETVPVVVE